jgi:hypothetical protein
VLGNVNYILKESLFPRRSNYTNFSSLGLF